MAASLTVTLEALEQIERLRARHGPVVFFQSGGCCAGSAAMCFTEGELPPGPGDVLLGTIGGAKFYVDADQYARWGAPRFEIDLGPGAGGGFSLEALDDVHFVTRTVTGLRESASG